MDTKQGSALLSANYQVPTTGDLSNWLVLSEWKEQSSNIKLTELLDSAVAELNPAEARFQNVKLNSCQMIPVSESDDFDSDAMLTCDGLPTDDEEIPLELELSLLDDDADIYSHEKSTHYSFSSAAGVSPSPASSNLDTNNNLSYVNRTLNGSEATKFCLTDKEKPEAYIQVQSEHRVSRSVSPKRIVLWEGQGFSCAHSSKNKLDESPYSTKTNLNDHSNSIQNNADLNSNILATNSKSSDDGDFFRDRTVDEENVNKKQVWSEFLQKSELKSTHFSKTICLELSEIYKDCNDNILDENSDNDILSLETPNVKDNVETPTDSIKSDLSDSQLELKTNLNENSIWDKLSDPSSFDVSQSPDGSSSISQSDLMDQNQQSIQKNSSHSSSSLCKSINSPSFSPADDFKRQLKCNKRCMVMPETIIMKTTFDGDRIEVLGDETVTSLHQNHVGTAVQVCPGVKSQVDKEGLKRRLQFEINSEPGKCSSQCEDSMIIKDLKDQSKTDNATVSTPPLFPHKTIALTCQGSLPPTQDRHFTDCLNKISTKIPPSSQTSNKCQKRTVKLGNHSSVTLGGKRQVSVKCTLNEDNESVTGKNKFGQQLLIKATQDSENLVANSQLAERKTSGKKFGSEWGNIPQKSSVKLSNVPQGVKKHKKSRPKSKRKRAKTLISMSKMGNLSVQTLTEIVNTQLSPTNCRTQTSTATSSTHTSEIATSSSSLQEHTHSEDNVKVTTEDPTNVRKFVKARRVLDKQKQLSTLLEGEDCLNESKINDRVQWVSSRWEVETLSNQDINLTTSAYIRRQLPTEEAACFQGCLEGQKDYTLAIVAPNRKRKLYQDDTDSMDACDSLGHASKKRRLSQDVQLIPDKVKDLQPDLKLCSKPLIEKLATSQNMSLGALNKQRNEEQKKLDGQFHYLRCQLQEKQFQEQQYFGYYGYQSGYVSIYQLQSEHDYQQQQLDMAMQRKCNDLRRNFAMEEERLRTQYKTNVEKIKTVLSENSSDSDCMTVALRKGPSRLNKYKTTYETVSLSTHVALAMVREDKIYDSFYSHKA